jgi:hypothetical protein
MSCKGCGNLGKECQRKGSNCIKCLRSCICCCCEFTSENEEDDMIGSNNKKEKKANQKLKAKK